MGGDGGGDNRKRGKHEGGGRGSKKAKYVANPVSSAAFPAGAQGILVTCDTYFENNAVRQALMLVEEHYDKLRGTEGGSSAAGGSAGTSGTKDISALLAEEVAELKDRSKQRFKKHDTGVKGCFLVTFPAEEGPSPQAVALSILREAKTTQQLRARNCNRFLPVTHSCHCSLEDIKQLAPKVLQGHFPEEEGATCIAFAAEFEHRSSDKLDRMEVINAFAQQIKCPPHKVNLKAPEKVILIQVVRNACGVAVVTDYHDLCRYNIKTITGYQDKHAQKAGRGNQGKGDGAAAKAEGDKGAKEAKAGEAEEEGEKAEEKGEEAEKVVEAEKGGEVAEGDK